MGNCNGYSAAYQVCKGCNRLSNGKNCDCTAGLDKICGRCDPSWLRQVPGTYDTQYNSWMAANPEPVVPALQEVVPITFSIECSVCNQSITQGQVTAGSVSQGAIDQTMNCFNQQISAAKAAADEAEAAAKAAAAAAPTAANQAAVQKAAADKQQLAAVADAATAPPPKPTVGQDSSTLMWILIIGSIFILLIVVAMVVSFTVKGRHEEYDGYDNEILV